MLTKFFFVNVILILLQSVVCQNNGCNRKKSNRLDFVANARKYGYDAMEHTVLTHDSYLLKLFNIPGGKEKQPVLLMHGIFDSADTFIIRGNTSMALTLADAGYDVWIGNVRGNRYGRRHEYLNPDIDDEFWDYSFHEMAMYDLPAIIDYVLMKTDRSKLAAIGHSQGNTIFYALGAMRPEYNKKISVMIALSPMCFLSHLDPAITNLIQTLSLVDGFFLLSGGDEVFGDKTIAKASYEEICGCTNGYNMCLLGFMFPLFGNDPDELETQFFPTIVDYYPTGTSRKNIIHMLQIRKQKKFLLYDYGTINLNLYKNSTPPQYDLGKVTMKVAMVVGKNDKLTPAEDVRLLRDSLPNVVEYHVVKYEKFNHIDAVWGKHMDKYLFPQVLSSLGKYTS